MITVDYSQIELRIAADESSDPTLTNIFLNGEDPHRDFASYLIGRSEITKDERYFGKTMNFSVGYGMSPKSMWEQLHKEGHRQWTLEDCIRAHEAWYKRYAGFKSYKHSLISDSIARGCYVRDRGGMFRYLPNLIHPDLGSEVRQSACACPTGFKGLHKP